MQHRHVESQTFNVVALALKQANAGGVRHGCFIEISKDTISSQR
jgi:hypothetical protein